jgi:hypothetical protein
LNASRVRNYIPEDFPFAHEAIGPQLSAEGQGDFIYAEPLNWQAAAEYDHGYNPTVALDTIYGVSWPNNNTQVPIVEVHQATVNSSELWFHVGVLKIGSTPSISLAGSHDTGFSGYAPSVSVADGLAILVYQGSGGSLWYSLGVVNNTTEDIAWGTPVNYATGYNPSVSLLGEQICCWFYGNWDVVEVHQQDNGTGPLTYRMGYMDAGSDFSYPTAVKWGPDSDTEFEASGCYPTVGQAAESGLFEVVVTSSTGCGKAANIISS